MRAKYLLILSSCIIFLILSGCAKEKKSLDAAFKMQKFVIDISNYAHNIDSNFIIIPQNGIELAFNNADATNGINNNYLSAIDGFGVEELFYFGKYSPDDYRLKMLRELVAYKKILVSEFTNSSGFESDALHKNYNEGFICFVRNADNYYYTQIPSFVPNENTNDIKNLEQAQNFLYIINSDNYASKQSFLNAVSSTNFDVILMDLFYNEEQFSADDINMLKSKANGAKRLVIAYMNIGSAENFRYYWQSGWKLHKPKWIKRKYKGYDDEYWVEFWNSEWQEIIFGNNNSYLYKIISSGFDGAYLDNVEAYYSLFYRN